jgi:hypothetical protein
MATFNGHRSWNAWNVSLWINNDEAIYNLALDCLKRSKSRRGAASAFTREIGSNAYPIMYSEACTCND